jgi:hypothetical protein
MPVVAAFHSGLYYLGISFPWGDSRNRELLLLVHPGGAEAPKDENLTPKPL